MNTLTTSSTTLPNTFSRLLVLSVLFLFVGVTRSFAQDGTTSSTFTVNEDFNSLNGALKLGARSGTTFGAELSISLTNSNGALEVNYYDELANENRTLLKVLEDARVTIGGGNIFPQSLLHIDSRAINGIMDVPASLQPQDIMNRLRFTNQVTGDTYTDGLAIGTYQDGTAVIEQLEDKNLELFTNGTNRMTIENDGQVTIGNDASVAAHPNAKLTVDGAVFISPEGGSTSDITSIAINSEHLVNEYLLWVDGGVVSEDFAISQAEDWADFVFEEGYQLRSLEEVETHIQEKGHLPTIPSAEEVKEGYNLHQMNKQMLQTIEELTLHTIEQNKQIKALMERVEQLEQK